MASGDLPTFYTWKIIDFGFSPHERFHRAPTKAELERAQVIVVRYKPTDPHREERYVTIRHPFGFGVLPLRTLMEDIQTAVEVAADRYDLELVEDGNE